MSATWPMRSKWSSSLGGRQITNSARMHWDLRRKPRRRSVVESSDPAGTHFFRSPAEKRLLTCPGYLSLPVPRTCSTLFTFWSARLAFNPIVGNCVVDEPLYRCVHRPTTLLSTTSPPRGFETHSSVLYPVIPGPAR